MPAPSYLPQVDSTGTRQPDDPSGIPSAIKTDGFPEIDNIPNSWWNWLFRTIYQWLVWWNTLFSVEHNATDGTHLNVTAISVTATGTISTSGSISAGNSVTSGSQMGTDGTLYTKRGVASGDTLIVGGVAYNEDEQPGVGASSTAEHEPAYYEIPANTLRVGTVVRVTSHWTLTHGAGGVTYRTRMGDLADPASSRTLVAAHIRSAGPSASRHMIRDEFRVVDAATNIVGSTLLTGLEDSTGVVAGSVVSELTGVLDSVDPIVVSHTIAFGTSDAGNDAVLDYFLVEILGN